MSTPTEAVYGSQVSVSGDLVVRDMVYRERHSIEETLVSNQSFYVAGDDVQEATRMVHHHDPVTSSAALSVETLRVDGDKHMVTSLGVAPSQTVLASDGVTATFSKGLSFDSDDSAIYFGGSKTFRIKYTEGPPGRLLFQCLDSGSYVTKFSCAKS